MNNRPLTESAAEALARDRFRGPFPLDATTPLRGLLGKMRIVFGVPLIYSILLPMVFFDLCLELYHRVCFTIFAIPKVQRRKYFIFDRHRVPHLHWFEKLNCLYCSYFNNLLAYAREVGARTERHWCPIKHAMQRIDPHAHYSQFFEYHVRTAPGEKKRLRVYPPDEARSEE